MQPIPITAVPVPLSGFIARVPAGFQSPVADHSQKRIDLNEHLVRNKEATFLFRDRGDSMIGIAVYSGKSRVMSGD